MPGNDTRRRRLEPWPIALMALLAAMIGTSVGFYRIAAANPDGVVTRDAFAAGLAYAHSALDAREAAQRGWTLDVATEPSPDGVRVRASLRDAGGAALASEGATLRRERPAEVGFDAEMSLARAADGALEADVVLPRPGRWDLVVAVERDGVRVARRVAVSAP